MRTLKFLSVLFLSASLFASPAPRPTGAVTLEWDAITDSSVTEIKVYYGTSSRHYEGFFVVKPTDVSCSVSALELGQEYFFAATTVNPAGESNFSVEASYLFDAPPRPRLPEPILNFHRAEKEVIDTSPAL